MKKLIITILILLGLGFAVWVFGTTQGANSPGTVASDNATGTIAWVNPTNATSSDNVYAVATNSGGSNSPSHYLKATNFGFSIPAGATIDGILVEIEKKSQSAFCKDINVLIIKSDGSLGTENKADIINNWSTSDTYKSYGSSSDLWSETWTLADINDADFGVVISANIIGFTTSSIDHIRITITYTEAVAGGGQKVQIKSGKFSIGSGKVFIKN